MSFERHDVVVTYSIVDANSSKSIEAFGERLKNIQDRLNKFHNGIGRVAKKQEDAGRKLTPLERMFKAFNKTIGTSNMKLFGLYFALGRISQGLWGLMQPAMDAFGIFDYWQIMLTDLFVPVMDDLFVVFDALMGVIMDLPEPVKKFIGYFALISAVMLSVTTAVIGFKIAMIAAQLAGVSAGLAIGAAFAWAAWIAAIVLLIQWIADLGSKIGGLWETIKAVARGIVRVFVILVAAVAGLFAELWNIVQKGWNTVVSMFEDGTNIIIDVINGLSLVPGIILESASCLLCLRVLLWGHI